jgi:hypothetical protein
VLGTAIIALSLLGSPGVATASTSDPAQDTASPSSWGLGVGTPLTRAGGLLSPLSLEIDSGSVAYVSQNFPGVLTRIAKNGTSSVIATAPGFEIGAVATRGDSVYFSEANDDHTISRIMRQRGNGAPEQLADLYAYESTQNPDAVNTYGFVGLPGSCASQFTPQSPTPASYTGIVDTHPYATLALSNTLFVADAGVNAILRIRYDGTVSTIAVLPPQPAVTITTEMAVGAGFPACVAGYPYVFEPVPTDVEIGPDGWLYVTTLPGGPEDASLGARGSVYKISPVSGETTLVATGFVGATGLGVNPKTGTVVVAELFGGPQGTGQVSVIDPGSSTPRPLVSLSSPSAIELRQNWLYVTTDSFVPNAEGIPQPIGKLTVVPVTNNK